MLAAACGEDVNYTTLPVIDVNLVGQDGKLKGLYTLAGVESWLQITGRPLVDMFLHDSVACSELLAGIAFEAEFLLVKDHIRGIRAMGNSSSESQSDVIDGDVDVEAN